MDMFTADKLMPAVTQPSKNLNLRGVGSQQTSRSRAERRNSPRVLRSALWGTDLDARPAVLSFNANERGFSTAGVK